MGSRCFIVNVTKDRRGRLILDVQLCEVLTGEQFEELVGELFRLDGYLVEYTPISGDQGIDLICKKGKESISIQCKRRKGNVGNGAVQEAYAGKLYWGTKDSIVVTNRYFTSRAISLAKALEVDLCDRDELSRMIDLVQEKWLESEKIIEIMVNSGYGALSVRKANYEYYITLMTNLLNYKEHFPDRLVYIYNNLGLLYSRLENSNLAISAFEEGINSLEREEVGGLVNNLIVQYIQLKKYEEAKRLFNEYKEFNFDYLKEKMFNL